MPVRYPRENHLQIHAEVFDGQPVSFGDLSPGVITPTTAALEGILVRASYAANLRAWRFFCNGLLTPVTAPPSTTGQLASTACLTPGKCP